MTTLPTWVKRDPNIEPLSSLAVVYPAFAEFVRADLNALNNSPLIETTWILPSTT